MTKPSTTLRGTGWLREAPGNLVPLEWLKVRGRSALRKCLFLPAPPGEVFGRYRNKDANDTIRDEPPHAIREKREQGDPFAPSPRRTPREERRSVRRPDTMRRAGMFPAYRTPQSRDLAAMRGNPRREAENKIPFDAGTAWWDAPLALGLMLVFLPPAGLAAVWSRPSYDRDAKWALTIATLLFMALGTVLALALLRR